MRWAAVWALSAGQEGEAEVPETNIVSDAVDGTSVDLEDEGVDVPKETAELVKLVSQERVQQRTAEQIEDAPQFLKETVEMPRISCQESVEVGWVLLRTLMQYLDTERESPSRFFERNRERILEQEEKEKNPPVFPTV